MRGWGGFSLEVKWDKCVAHVNPTTPPIVSGKFAMGSDWITVFWYLLGDMGL